jgi:hypothetical protein
MATEYGGLNRGFITAITKFQDDYPVFSRAERNELLNLFSRFDNESLGVVAQMTMRMINNTDKQKRLLAGENVWICN